MATANKTKDSKESVVPSLRPVAKVIIKAGLVAYDSLRQTVSQAADFVQEAREELGRAGNSEIQADESKRQPKRSQVKPASRGRSKRTKR